jgi:hypothetical protein
MRYLLVEIPDVLHLDPAAEFEFEDGGLVAEGVSAVRQLLCLLADEATCDDVTDRVRVYDEFCELNLKWKRQ